VIDYQNVNLVGLNLFRHSLQNKSLSLNPLKFSEQLLIKRELNQKSEKFKAILGQVIVFSGLPSPTYDPEQNAKAWSQKAKWEQDSKVSIYHRPLKYDFQRDETGKIILDESGSKIVIRRREKGIDVLCALALVREAKKFDLVILASQDSDLIPAIDEACALGSAKIETFSWYTKDNRRSRELKPEKHKVWNTRLDELDYLKCLD